MSEEVNPTPSVTPTTGQQATDATQKATGSAEGDYTSATKVSTVQDLKEVAPKVYDSMMEGIAMSIVSRMRKAQARLKKMMRQSRH